MAEQDLENTSNPTSPAPQNLEAALVEPLLAWFARAARALPWRNTDDPYAIWVSEMMLQQTQVATVIPYFRRWMERFPTVRALAAATEEDVLSVWQGLGYYARARNLRRGAREVMALHGGVVPTDPDLLRALPGIGPYTAGAIASIAYNRPAPIVDGNVTRVLCRWFGLEGDPAKQPLRGRLWSLATELIPPGRARDFNPALMEWGATICLPGNPHCGECPVAAGCAARRTGRTGSLPESAPRPAVTAVRMAAAVVRRGEEVLVTRRGAAESRWAGMWQFPNDEVRQDESSAAAAVRALQEAIDVEAVPAGEDAPVRHSVTRYRITLHVHHFRVEDPPATDPCATAHEVADAVAVADAGGVERRWARLEALSALPMPAAHRTIVCRLQRAAPDPSSSAASPALEEVTVEVTVEVKAVMEVALALIRRGDRYLVTRRREGAHLAGYWEFPGGKCRGGESPADAAMREAAEEVGVRCEVVRPRAELLWTYPERTVRLHPIECRYVEGPPRALEVVEWAWVRAAELSDYRFPPANAGLIRDLVAEARGEQPDA
jgi:A/G-specific adenine glycosylase